MRHVLGALIAFFIAFPAFTHAATVSYDASSGVLPSAPFSRFDATHPVAPNPFGFDAAQSVAGGVLSTGPTDQALYTFYLVNSLILDHTKNVEVSASLRLISQSSIKPADRAGLALALTDDRNLYTELYIGAGEIFINKAGRVRDAAASVDTSVFHDYALKLHGDAVTVSVDGVDVLSSTIFDVTGIALPTLANWGVVGDITSDATGIYELKTFAVSVNDVPGPTPIPLPPSAWAALITLTGTFMWRRFHTPAR